MVIYEFKKNALEKVKIQILKFKGRKVIDIRVYYHTSATSNEWSPCRKGICMSVNRLDELLEGLQLAHKIQLRETNQERDNLYSFEIIR